jgi:hypothetical protein
LGVGVGKVGVGEVATWGIAASDVAPFGLGIGEVGANEVAIGGIVTSVNASWCMTSYKS